MALSRTALSVYLMSGCLPLINHISYHIITMTCPLLEVSLLDLCSVSPQWVALYECCISIVYLCLSCIRLRDSLVWGRAQEVMWALSPSHHGSNGQWWKVKKSPEVHFRWIVLQCVDTVSCLFCTVVWWLSVCSRSRNIRKQNKLAGSSPLYS